MTCFVDTSALLAVMDKDDAFHKEAKAVWERLTEQQATLVATNYVVLETVALLQHRIGVPAVRRFHDDILPILTIDWISSGQHTQGMAALLAADRRNLSLVDCVSFDAMRKRGLRQAFAFDKHFEEQGFATEGSS
jgi:predicted nucleic acid-binding protein